MKNPSTVAVARQIGVNLKTLQSWVRDGKISVDTKGEGTQRRILWTDESIAQATRLRDRVAGDSALATSLGPDLAAALELARQAMNLKSDADVIVATPESARVFRNDSTLADVLRRIRGNTMVLIG